MFTSFVKEGVPNKPLSTPVFSATSPYIDITLARSLFPAPEPVIAPSPPKLGSVLPREAAVITSSWQVGSAPYCITQRYYDRETHPSPRPRVPRAITQAYIDPSASTAGADFLASVNLGVIPLTAEQRFWEVREGLDGKIGLLLGPATKQFRSIVLDTLQLNLVSAVRHTDSVWSK